MWNSLHCRCIHFSSPNEETFDLENWEFCSFLIWKPSYRVCNKIYKLGIFQMWNFEYSFVHEIWNILCLNMEILFQIDLHETEKLYIWYKKSGHNFFFLLMACQMLYFPYTQMGVDFPSWNVNSMYFLYLNMSLHLISGKGNGLYSIFETMGAVIPKLNM